MKFLSVLLVVCLFFLSVAGMIRPAVTPTVKDCCQRMAAMRHSSCPGKTAYPNKACDRQGCAMMLSCNICGFFGTEYLRVPSNPAKLVTNPVPPYKTGSLPAYYSSDWKPPKTC